MSQQHTPIVVSANFSRGPVTGAQLRVLVQRMAADDDNLSYVEERLYLAGQLYFACGLTSAYPQRQFRITRGNHGEGNRALFELDEPIRSVALTSYSWGNFIFSVGFSPYDVRKCLTDHARTLEYTYHICMQDGFPDYQEPRLSEQVV